MRTFIKENTTKILIVLSIIYLLFLLTIIAINTGNGRYQFKADSPAVIDTRTGKLFLIKDGKISEVE